MEPNTNSNQMAVYNILFAADLAQGGDSYASMVRSKLEEEFNIRVGLFNLVNDFHFVDQAVSDKTYDIIICNEALNNKGVDKQIGSGTIQSWKANNPNIRIILLVGDGRRAGTKLKKLFDAEYYDCLYYSDLDTNFKELAYLITHGRSRDDAFCYYDLGGYIDNVGDISGQTPAKQTSEEQNSIPQPEHSSSSISENSYENVDANAVKHDAPETVNEHGVEEKTIVTGNGDFAQQSTPNYSTNQSMYGSFGPTGMGGYQQPVENIPYGMPAGNNGIPQGVAYETGNEAQGMADNNTQMPYGYRMNPQNPMYHEQPVQQAPENVSMENQGIPEVETQNAGAYSENEPVLHDMAHMETTTQNEFPDMSDKISGNVSAENTKNYVNRKEEKTMEKPSIIEQSFATNKTAVAAVAENYESSVTPQEGFVVSAVSDSVLIVEIPGAHFLSNKEELRKLPINLITPRM